MVASLFSGLASLASGYFNQKSAENAMQISYEQQRALNEQSLDLSKNYTNWLNTTQYKAMRTGLEKAGYNPMLAINKDPMHGVIQGGSSNAISADIGNTVANAHRAFNLETQKNKADIANIEASTKATNAGTSLTIEQAKTEQYKQKQMEAETTLSHINALLKDKELSWYDKRQLAEIKTMIINAQANHAVSEAAQLNAHTAQQEYNLKKGITDYDNLIKSAEAEWNKSHPRQASLLHGLYRYGSALGSIFTPSVGAGAGVYMLHNKFKKKPKVGF